jgi:lipopolysaccharide export system permease protein
VLLKKLHTLTLRAYLPPFIATLFISVFLLFLVQIVITYLDDFIGKGLRTLDLLTLFGYAWITIIPQCIPLAVLLASIMSFGNLAESYELAAMKASGISLFSILRPVFVFIILLAGVTFLFNNFILPVVSLKTSSLLYDIRQKKPTVNIKEGIFYNGIDNYSLRVGGKSENRDTLYDIYIYDHTSLLGNNVQLYARSGKISTTADTSALVQVLHDGRQYEEVIDRSRPGARALRIFNFKTLEVRIPLDDFKFKRTEEELFKGDKSMLNVWQLDSVADSNMRVIGRRNEQLLNQARTHFYFRVSTSVAKVKFPLVKVHTFYDSLPDDLYTQAIQNALNLSRTASGAVEAHAVHIEADTTLIREFKIEWHDKIVICFACIVLFFVGAPLGAIIKKGGLGLPVIISVLFFLAYYILTEMFKQLAIDGKLPPWQALWMPLLIFLPISILLTVRAARDAVIIDLSWYYRLLSYLRRKKKSD